MIIAILEDSIAQATAIEKWLRRAQYDTCVAHDGHEFMELLRREPADMLLLDWDVPGMTGIEVLQEVRRTLSDALPIVIFTNHSSEEDIVYGLNAGADDYLVKPVSERVLVARVAAQLRKYYPEKQRVERIEVGRYAIDIDARTITVAGDAGDAPKVVDQLSAREFDLAVLLFRNAGRIVTKDYISKQIWGVVDRKYDASVATYVSKLRSTLALRRKNGLVISTIYNHGYRLERSQDI
ncbi:response regulator transcription factor [Burkholderia ubonensis]|uniref:Two-component system response regulator n=1 Tax=Burkholderia ubonensis TaxID=101571 RepID=A0AAW3MQG5_9BURK|nr:response regulator transcription factor [Burkholderia ubonensis]KVK98985.1 two-component system response regulator [Burkholderia ubonensis]KVN83152.1 two-component system response regulator [Burkholderia ubonensis]KVO39553.1 two-component system response regulator [Burkholderia ubonensis]KVP89345.1 two-component system response regulator [Burkholderia ubonensis]KVQ54181.1 two-component system response regulator [Burkholderia ubonensis]